MRTLAYSPSVRLYAMHVGKGGEKTYYDLSRDVVSCNVSLMENGSGTLTAKLQNRDGKYDGKFLPMDLVVASCDSHKGERRLFTGYVNRVKGFSLYPGDYTLSASDALYRLQRLYWDPALFPSWKMVYDNAYGDYTEKGDMGAAQAIAAVLTNVAGMDPSMVDVGEIPSEMTEFAKDVWKAGQEGSAKQLERMAEFLKVLGKSGQSVYGGGSSGASTAGGVSGITVPADWKGHPEIVNYALSCMGTPYLLGGMEPHVGIDCSGLVCWSYLQAGIDLVSLGARTADEITLLLPHREVRQEDAKAGDLVSWYGPYDGKVYWYHIAICDGHGQLVESTTSSSSGIYGVAYREIYSMGERMVFFHPDVLDTISEVK